MGRGKIIRSLEAEKNAFVCDGMLWEILISSGTDSEQWERGSYSHLCDIWDL